jgi:pilus assembly protein CpaF
MDTTGNPNQPSFDESDRVAVWELERRLRHKIMTSLDLQALGLSGSGQDVNWSEKLAQGEEGVDPALAQENLVLSDRLWREIQERFDATLADENIVLSQRLRKELLDVMAADLLLLGPLEPILANETVTEIMVDGYNRVYIEREGSGKFEDVPSHFRDDEHLLEIIRRIASPLGRRINESEPMMDLRLPDGSRVNAVIPPIARNGPLLTIRKFSPDPITLEDLLRFGNMNEDMSEFLRACVRGRLNIVVAGMTGSGKTSILNVLANMIPEDQRIINIQHTDELTLRHKYLVTLESRPPNLEGKGEISIRDLVINALRMRPDRIITSEVRGGEALSLLEAMNIGHDGCMFTIHATMPLDALARMEVMVTSANPSIPLLHVRQMIASGLNLIVHQERLRDGTRRQVRISEVEGIQGDAIVLSDIFEFRQTGQSAGKINGYFTATGRIPKFLSQLNAAGVDLPLSLFTPR